MMRPVGFRLRAWESWAPDRDTDSAGVTPALLRRRVTPIGQQALQIAWRLPEAAQARLVLSSRHGEFCRTLSLLDAVTHGNDPSPADFTLSVHHALISLLSIAHRNRRGHIAVAAGEESFCFGLMEAIGCLAENPNESVVLLHYDEPLSGPYSTFNKSGEQPLALALVLAATGEGEPFLINAEPVFREGHSASHALDFLRFLKSDMKDGLSIGEHRQWKWSKHAPV